MILLYKITLTALLLLVCLYILGVLGYLEDFPSKYDWILAGAMLVSLVLTVLSAFVAIWSY